MSGSSKDKITFYIVPNPPETPQKAAADEDARRLDAILETFKAALNNRDISLGDFGAVDPDSTENPERADGIKAEAQRGIATFSGQYERVSDTTTAQLPDGTSIKCVRDRQKAELNLTLNAEQLADLAQKCKDAIVGSISWGYKLLKEWLVPSGHKQDQSPE